MGRSKWGGGGCLGLSDKIQDSQLKLNFRILSSETPFCVTKERINNNFLVYLKYFMGQWVSCIFICQTRQPYPHTHHGLHQGHLSPLAAWKRGRPQFRWLPCCPLGWEGPGICWLHGCCCRYRQWLW